MTTAHAYITHPVQQTESYPLGEADGSHLSPLDRDWLSRIPYALSIDPKGGPGWWEAEQESPAERAARWLPARMSGETMIVVYRGEFGLEMGAVRGVHRAGSGGWTEDTYEVSPFPGAWENVGVSRILLVRHPETI